MNPTTSCSHAPAALGLLAAALLILAYPVETEAQIRASEPASVMQTIDGTVITIDYFRPKARGRAPLFGEGGVVWEHVWTPGANWATKIAFEKPITLEGEAVEPGEYSMWMILSDDELLPRELILHPEPRLFHTDPPAVEEAVVRVPLDLTEAPHREMLTWEFEEVRINGATLALHWGDVRIPLEVGVEPSMREAPEPGVPAMSVSLTLTQAEDGVIHADMDGVPEGGPTWMNEWDFVLLPLADRIFAWGEAMDGKPAEVWPDVTVEFSLEGDPAGSFEVRGEEDQIMARGERAG
ncbi:MAG: DUF2911 domain-containing protein [Gemmatimonadota bacterium]